MRRIVLVILAGVAGAGAAHAQQAVETGVPRGSLAVAAIDRGDLVQAERLLAASTLEGDDPARLINLGYVYQRQGRQADAVEAWRAALSSPRHRWIETLSGREVRTDRLAREILARQLRTIASR